jgi:anthranilate synthase component 2
VRYHSLIFKDLPEQLKIIAKTKNGEIMALRHKKLLIYGLQFHPEAILTDFGLQILKNWINLIG